MAVRGSVQRVQDAVHGLMEFRGLEAAIIEVLRVRELQRLRRIRQLGLLHLVFPAGEHTRLVHCLGAAHVALRFGRRLENATREFLVDILRPDEEARRDLGLAALCHDLGHGPLSHAWEREVVREFDAPAWAETLGLDSQEDWRSVDKWHELVGQAILLWPESEIHQLLETHEEGLAARVAGMLRGEYYLDYLPRLLSGDIDVDRCDFLLRDAHQTGVGYGRFDLDWLISTATVGVTSANQLVVGFDRRKAPRVIEQFLVARRALYDTVYQHRVARSAEGMVGLLLRRLRDLVSLESWPLPSTSLFDFFKRAVSGNPLTPEEVLRLDDYSLGVVMTALADGEGKDPIAEDISLRILRRDLLKRVPVDEDDLADFMGRFGRERLEEVVARHVGADAGPYYLHYEHEPFHTFSKDETKSAYLVDEAVDGPGEATLARDLEELRPLFESSTPASNLYAPHEAVDDLVIVIQRASL